MSNPDSPYVGPRPFMKGDENIFYGRNAEAQALTSLIVSHRAVLLYSQSGAGKTSLLNAKVRQLLEAREVDVLGSSRVGGSLPPEVNPADIENIFVYFALISLEGDRPSKQLCTGKTTLPEYLKTLPRRTRSDGGLVQRVIFFDQFEEIFTTSQQRWQNRRGFFEQVGQALEADPLLRVVFAMREEYLASLGVHVANLPERLRTRFHLERLRYEAALEAVSKPLEGTNRRFATGVAEQLVQNLLRVPVRTETGFEEMTGEFVEPVQLQVVCQNIWNSLDEKVTEITAKFVEGSGDVDVALTNYYEDCLKRIIEKHAINETRLRRWFDKELITADGLRGIVYRGETTTGTLPNEIVSMLEDLRLVRAEPRGGALWYELTHDRFIAPIRSSNRKWFANQQGGFESALEIKADEFKKDPRDENYIRGSELKNALAWLQTADAEGSVVSDVARAYVVDSKNAASKRRARSLRRQVAALILLFFGALFVAGWAYRQKGNAERARYDERVEVANTMIALKKYHDALVWGLKSAEPSITQQAAPSAQSIESLRNALKAVGGSIWSRPLASRPKLAVSPDGGLVATVDDKEFVLWNGANGKRVFSQQFDKDQDSPTSGQKTNQGAPAERARIIGASFSPGGKYLIIRKRLQSSDEPRSSDPFQRGPNYKYEIWDLQNKLERILPDRSLDSIQFANDDSRVLIGEKLKLSVIEVASKRVIFSLEGKEDSNTLSPSGQQLYQISKGAVVIYDFSQAETKINRMAFLGSEDSSSAVFSEDGTRFLTFQDHDNDKSVLTLWDTKSGKKVRETTINSKDIIYSFKIFRSNNSVLLTNNGSIGSADSQIPLAQIWDVTTNTFTGIEGNLTRLTLDDRSWFFVRTDKTSRTILRDPRDQSGAVVFTDLPEKLFKFLPSKQLNAAATLTSDDNVLQYWRPGNSLEEIDKLSPPELYHSACTKLQYQEKEFQQVSSLCQPLLK